MVQKSFDGTLAVGDLWRLINEHRVFFPNMITVGLARLTHWNIYYELAATQFFAALTFFLVWVAVRRAERRVGVEGSQWVIPVVGLLIFSYTQWSVWTWGLHLMIPMTAALLIAVALLMSDEKVGPRRLGAACALAVVASYSFGAGIMVWPMGACLIGLANLKARKGMIVHLSVWCACGALTMAVYFIGYKSTLANQHAMDAFGSPVAFASYVLAYLGAPIVAYHPLLAVGAGLFGIVAFIALLRAQFRAWPDGLHAILPFCGLALCGCLIGVLTALKQWHEGMEQALSSRYIVWPTLFWVGFVCIGYTYGLKASRVFGRGHAMSVGVIVVFLVVNSGYGTYRADERHDAFLIGRRALVDNTNEEDLRFLYPDIEIPKLIRPILVEYRLTVFGE